MPPPINNHLRRHRRRAGLSHGDIAFLLGCRDGSFVSRHEQNRREPSLRTALAYQAIHGLPVSDLFPGIYNPILNAVTKQAASLRCDLARRPADARQRAKLAALRLIVGPEFPDRPRKDVAR